jgi:polar amino acid transport system substrate-binding protein
MLLFAGALQCAEAQRPPGVPEAGASPRIDQILKRGTLRVGVLAIYPWLFRNKMPAIYGNNDPWRGSSWILAKAYAKALGVKFDFVEVSEDTKVALVVSGGIDVTITALAPTPQREKVVDFIVYSTGANCMIGLKNNPKLAGITEISQLNDPKFTFAAFAGTQQQTLTAQAVPKAQLRVVNGAGNGAIDEVISGRSDLAANDSPDWPMVQFAYPDRLVSFPSDCLNSTFGSHDVGHAIAKNQPVFLDFLRGIAAKMKTELHQEDLDTYHFAEQHPDQL